MYLLDANIFIEAQNRYYSFDIVPAFWDWMDSVFGPDFGTIRPVRDELLGKGDELDKWMAERKDESWILAVDDEETQVLFGEIASELVGSGRYHEAGVAQFLDGADPWLVAKAQVLGATIVTHEVPNAQCRRRVPLPNLCQERGINFIDTFDAMRNHGAQFRL